MYQRIALVKGDFKPQQAITLGIVNKRVASTHGEAPLRGFFLGNFRDLPYNQDNARILRKFQQICRLDSAPEVAF
jgi:hypothetical protein